jgi:hypothetical protein
MRVAVPPPEISFLKHVFVDGFINPINSMSPAIEK